MSKMIKSVSKYKANNKHKFRHFSCIFVILLKIVSFKLLCKNEIRDLVDYFSEIHLIIQGSDNQQLLNSGFEIEPSEVLLMELRMIHVKKHAI